MRRISMVLLLGGFVAAGALGLQTVSGQSAAKSDRAKILEFQTMIGVPPSRAAFSWSAEIRVVYMATPLCGVQPRGACRPSIARYHSWKCCMPSSIGLW